MTHSGRRSGFTLVELLVVMVLLSIVAGSLLNIILRQQRFYAGATDIMETRGGVREAADLLASELRPLSPSGGDIYTMTSSSIDFREQFGASIVCVAAANSLVVPPVVLASRAGYTALLRAPEAGDSVFVLDGSVKPAVWRGYQLADALSAGTCPTTTGFTSTSSEAAAGLTVSLDQPLAVGIGAGSPVRFWRRARLGLYAAADGFWYLGYQSCSPLAGACTTVQPVSGPYLARSGTPPGLSLSYFDGTGAVTANPLQVRRIWAVVRARSRHDVRGEGGASRTYVDSMAIGIAMRN